MINTFLVKCEVNISGKNCIVISAFQARNFGVKMLCIGKIAFFLGGNCLMTL